MFNKKKSSYVATKKHTNIRVLAVILAIVIAVIGVKNIASFISKNKQMEDIASRTKTMSSDSVPQALNDYYASLQSEKSDIEGWSKFDKLQAGLGTEDDSDYDGDGLSDAKEIEIGSDPKKISTADDMYTDLYKYENGLDVTKALEASEEAVFEGNITENVTLLTENQNNLGVKIYGYETPDTFTMNEEWYDEYEIYVMYSIGGNYTGRAEFDLSSYTDDVTDVEIIKYTTTSKYVVLDKEDYNIEKRGSVITLDLFSSESQTTHLAFVVKGKEVAYSSAGATEDSIVDYPATVEEGGLVDDFKALIGASSTKESHAGEYTIYSLTAFAPSSVKMYYVSTGDGLQDQAMISKALSEIRFINEDYREKIGLSNVYACTEDEYVEITNSLPRKIMKGIFTVKDVNNVDNIDKGRGILPVVIGGENVGKTSTDDNGVTTTYNKNGKKQVVTGFTEDDLFAFPNFASYISKGGNCAGIVYYEQQLYANGEMPKSGSEGDISFNASHPENSTLFDSGLSDYLTSSWSSDSMGKYGYIEEGALPDYQNAFVKMIGAYWKYENLMDDNNSSLVCKGSESFDHDSVYRIKASIDNGEVLIVNMSAPELIYDYDKNDAENKAALNPSVKTDANGNAIMYGHAVLIYGYDEVEEKLDDGTIEKYTKLYVYDPNYTADDRTMLFGDGSTLGDRAVIKLSYNDDGSFEVYYAPFVQYENCRGDFDSGIISSLLPDGAWWGFAVYNKDGENLVSK